MEENSKEFENESRRFISGVKVLFDCGIIRKMPTIIILSYKKDLGELYD